MADSSGRKKRKVGDRVHIRMGEVTMPAVITYLHPKKGLFHVSVLSSASTTEPSTSFAVVESSIL